MSLVLSLFPSIGMLDLGFEQEGFCVVRGPDVIWGGRIEEFHPPAGVFDGIIGGDPCQSHSALANLVRAKGLEPSFPDMTPEFCRVIDEAQPAWFLRENVPRAPELKPLGYDVRSFLLDHSHLDSGDGTGHEQMRKRRFWFGMRDEVCPELRQWIDFALFELPDKAPSVRPITSRISPGATRGTTTEEYRRRRVTSVTAGHDGHTDSIEHNRRKRKRAAKTPPVTGRNEGRVGSPTKDYSPPRRKLSDMCELQGLPPDWLDHQPWTMGAKRKMIGNGVPIPMARAIARAVLRATTPKG